MMTHLQFALVGILTLAFLSSCNRHFSANEVTDVTADLTYGQNAEGRSYTSFSDPASVQNIKDQIVISDENKKFAENILSVQKTFLNGQIKISLHWKGLAAPLVFSSNVQLQNSIYQAQMTDSSGQRKDLEMNLACDASNCESASAILKDQNSNMLGLILRSESKNLTVVEGNAQSQSFKLLSKETQDAFKSAQKGFSVVIRSYEIYPGASYYEISDGANKIEGELLNIDEGAAATQTTGIFAKLGMIELIGNNQGNSEGGAELQFRITNKIGDKVLLSYITMETNVPAFTIHSADVVGQLGANSLVQQILDDENNDVVKAYISSHLAIKNKTSKSGSQPSGVQTMLKYLACNEGDRTICTKDRAGHDKPQALKNIVETLRQEGFPAAWALISYMESQLDSSAYNRSSGAEGYWQFIPGTARVFKLIQNGKDLRSDLKASTHAAAAYFKLLLSYWNGDVKMSVISYNMGQAAAEKACDRGSDTKTNCNIEINNRRNQNKQISELYDLNKKDFWKLYSLHVFGSIKNGATGQDYVLRFLSENLVSFHPEHYGYSNRAVDLN